MLLRLIFAVFPRSDIAAFLFITGSFLKHENMLPISREQLPNLTAIQTVRVAIMLITNKYNIILVPRSMCALGNRIQNTEPSAHIDKFRIPQLTVLSSQTRFKWYLVSINLL